MTMLNISFVNLKQAECTYEIVLQKMQVFILITLNKNCWHFLFWHSILGIYCALIQLVFVQYINLLWSLLHFVYLFVNFLEMLVMTGESMHIISIESNPIIFINYCITHKFLRNIIFVD